MRARAWSSRCLSLILVTALFAIACGDDDAMSTTDGGDPNTVSVPIGPAGGQASLSSGASVTIPAGALTEEITIGVSEVDNLPPLPTGHVRSGTALAFTPHGTTFAMPVTLRVPFTGTASLVARLDDANDTSWDILNVGNFAGGIVTFEVDGFSIYVPVRRTSGMITLDGGGGSSGASGTGGTGGDAGSAGTGGTQPIDAGGGTGGTGTDLDAGVEADAGAVADASVGTDAGPSCSFDLCGGNCIDTSNDVRHCGACDQRCGEGESCVNGACECPIDNRCSVTIANDGDAGIDADAGAGDRYLCANLELNRFHCGACNNACVTGETCIDGACTPITCSGSDIRCGNECVDAQTSETHCGGCSLGGEPGHDGGMLCYVEDYYCELDCVEGYGGNLCATGVPGYSACVDLAIDRDNCGDCGAACTESQICSDGLCEELTCGAGEVACDGACVSGESCGESCGANATCNAGACECDGNTTACLAGCVDTNSDDNNCGACGVACTNGDSCVNGACDCVGTNPDSCEGYCTDLDNDPYNCGACYNYCYGNEECVAGVCVLPACQAGETRCGSTCVDTDSDPTNCGGCAPKASTGMEACLAGETCFCSSYGLTECSIGGGLAVCTDTTMDRDHCGQCGNACATGDECVSGTCQAIDCGTQTLCGNTCVDSPSCGVQCDVRAGELCGGGTCYQGT